MAVNSVEKCKFSPTCHSLTFCHFITTAQGQPNETSLTSGGSNTKGQGRHWHPYLVIDCHPSLPQFNTKKRFARPHVRPSTPVDSGTRRGAVVEHKGILRWRYTTPCQQPIPSPPPHPTCTPHPVPFPHFTFPHSITPQFRILISLFLSSHGLFHNLESVL